MTARLGLIADDLSGASDTGVQFAKLGARTVVLLQIPELPVQADVLVVDTDSRSCSESEARTRVGAAASWMAGTADILYKKIDSTLRGNVGAEIDAFLAGSGADVAVVAPSFPANGRTAREGRLLVRGIRLDRTEFAGDPIWPATDSRIGNIIARQSDHQIAVSHIGFVPGDADVQGRWRMHARTGARIWVVDAETSAELAIVARAIVAAGGHWVGVGSAGLAEEIAASLKLQRDQDSARMEHQGKRSGGVLTVAGSPNPITVAQVSSLVEETEATAVKADVGLLVAGGSSAERDIARCATEVVAALERDRDAVITLAAMPQDATFAAIASDARIGVAAATSRLTAGLGRIAASALAVCPRIRGIVLTGGDTARAVLLALDAEGLTVSHEISPGIPSGQVLGGRMAGLPIVTKAGGFGDANSLIAAQSHLKRPDGVG